jgi:hypothetical protein
VGRMREKAWLLLVAIISVSAAACSTTPRGSNTSKPRGTATTHATADPTRVVSVVEPWRLPQAVSRPVAVGDGTNVLLLGGLGVGDISTSAVVAVNVLTGKSQLAGQHSVAVHDAAGASINGQAFVFGGGSQSSVSSVQTWQAGTGTVAGSLPGARSDLASATIGATTYLLGGFDGSQLVGTVLATTDGTRFSTAGQLAQPVRYPAVTVLDGKVWVIGGLLGITETNAGAQTPDVQRFDPATGRTVIVGRLPVALAHAAAVVIDGQLFVAGGKVDGQPQSQIYRIDPQTGVVTLAGVLPGPRADCGVYASDGRAWLLGGELADPTGPLDSVVLLASGS